MPIASATAAIVLAVYMPPQAPSPGQIARSIRSTSSRVILPARQAPTASKASMIVTSWPSTWPGMIEPAYRKTLARSSRAAAISMPGQRLVAAGEQHRAVEPLGHHHRLDRVGDHLAGDQREVHALVAHRDAVGDRDGAELERVAAGRVHAVLDRLREPVRATGCRG